MATTTNVTLGNRIIGAGHPPFIIAEMSGNHNQSLDRALEIVDAAAAAGAHALKIQTYTADTMTLDLAHGEFFISDPKSPWAGRSLYSLYEEAATPWEWHNAIASRCHDRGLLFFSTPFDESAVDFLETLNVPFYKVASFENTDHPLLRKVAATGKPLILSTGMATVGELDEAVRVARAAGCRDLILLKCTSTYPASPDSSNIQTIPHMRQLFTCEVGLSDHTLGVGVAVASVALGATVIEKHFTLRRSDGGVDAAFSLEPDEFRCLVDETSRAAAALGTVRYGPTEPEKNSLTYRRSLYVTRDIAADETFTRENVRAVRPGLGLAPKHFDSVLRRRAARAIKAGTPLAWDLIR